jgi:hypothetical protein
MATDSENETLQAQVSKLARAVVHLCEEVEKLVDGKPGPSTKGNVGGAKTRANEVYRATAPR